MRARVRCGVGISLVGRDERRGCQGRGADARTGCPGVTPSTGRPFASDTFQLHGQPVGGVDRRGHVTFATAAGSAKAEVGAGSVVVSANDSSDPRQSPVSSGCQLKMRRRETPTRSAPALSVAVQQPAIGGEAGGHRRGAWRRVTRRTTRPDASSHTASGAGRAMPSTSKYAAPMERPSGDRLSCSPRAFRRGIGGRSTPFARRRFRSRRSRRRSPASCRRR